MERKRKLFDDRWACVAPPWIFPQGHKRLFSQRQKVKLISSYLGFRFPFPLFAVHLSHCCPCCGTVQTSRSSPATLKRWLPKEKKRKKKTLLCSPSNFTSGLHQETERLCGHHAAELSRQTKDYPQPGRKRSRTSPVPTFQVIYLF